MTRGPHGGIWAYAVPRSLQRAATGKARHKGSERTMQPGVEYCTGGLFVQSDANPASLQVVLPASAGAPPCGVRQERA